MKVITCLDWRSFWRFKVPLKNTRWVNLKGIQLQFLVTNEDQFKGYGGSQDLNFDQNSSAVFVAHCRLRAQCL